MILKLNDGTEFNVDDSSDICRILLTVDTETMKEAIEKITTNNLKHATMGDILFVNAVVNEINVNSPNPITGEVNVIFYLGEKSEMDIINERLDEQDIALMELAELIGG